MVLYHTITVYQLLCAIIHKQLHHREEESLLLFPKTNIEKLPQYQELIDRGFFSDICFIPNEMLRTTERMKKEDIEAYNKLLPYSIGEYSNIYVGGLHYKFAIYLIKKDIRFSAFEEAAGIASRPEILRSIIMGINTMNVDIIDEYQLIDMRNEHITKVYCNMSAQAEGYMDSRAEDFDIISLFSLIDEQMLSQLKELFRCPSVKCDSEIKSALVLTQHFANLRILTFENQITIYQYLFDYFLEGYKLFIKTHPSDIMYYDYLFPQACIIRDNFPSEFVPYVFDNLPQMVATLTSTSINHLKGFFTEIISFDTEIERAFSYLHSYYFAMRIISYLGKTQYSTVGTFDTIINNFEQHNNVFANLTHANYSQASTDLSTLLIDKICQEDEGYIHNRIQELDNDEVLIFLNSDSSFSFIDIENKEAYMEHIVTITIEKKSNRNDEVYSDLSQEVIYIMTKNKECRRMIYAFDEKKELNNSGLSLSVKVPRDEQMRIKVLEGILEATEKRLEKYIGAFEELK